MKYSKNIQEQELKNKVAQDFFGKYDHTEAIKKIDFAVRIKRTGNTLDIHGDEYLFWAETKAGQDSISAMLTQLVLTVGKDKIHCKYTPPPFLGCFDCERITFVSYHEFQDILQMHINWNVTSSRRDTSEFETVRNRINKIDRANVLTFDFEKNEPELRAFIGNNFDLNRHPAHKIQIDKNNFINIYNKWLEKVKPTIGLDDWNAAKKNGIIDGDFYLADLLSENNMTIRQKLFVLLKQSIYQMDRHKNERGLFTSEEVEFTDKQRAHTEFWAIYKRPPLKEYWDYIVDRRDLLVPQDIRERKGSFYTPQIWVELSQKYIADVFGEDWQEEYYVWDCAAGTGNLLTGLTNKYNIWASTLDKQDVQVMHDRIKNGANLLEDHCFQFDFLNDDFSKLPQKLREIIEKTPERLIVYINPPYAEAGNKKTMFGHGEHKAGVSNTTAIYYNNSTLLGKAKNELFAQFLIRIYVELRRCKIANFATLKALCASNFSGFRDVFRAKLETLFLVPANTFDNVDGKFPIGFHIWDTAKTEIFEHIAADVFSAHGKFLCQKAIYSYDDSKIINDWILEKLDEKNKIGHLSAGRNDFQHNNLVFIGSRLISLSDRKDRKYRGTLNIDAANLIKASIYLAVCHSIEATWLNDRDQFLYPNDGWEADKEFQNDCLAFALFHDSNNISSTHGVNHWIPFTEKEVNARDSFESHFMVSFMTGKIIQNGYSNLFEQVEDRPCIKRVFSLEAKAVFNAGRKLWKYYHEQPKANVNASYYDIREHFQGRKADGKMNAKSEDEEYTKLIGGLREAMKVLANKIEPKIYEYGFLRG